jgi:tRNA (cmo5U34)-methyltransferase
VNAPVSGSRGIEIKDTVFAEVRKTTDFAFDAKVSAVFDDMVSRSVPHYAEIQRMTSDLAAEFLPERDGMVCDLGCSTATTIDLLAAHPRCPASTRFLGIDDSPHMLGLAREKLGPLVSSGRAELREANLNDVAALPPSNVVLLNWTLQFVRPLHREALLRRIHDAIEPCGALFLSEKVLVSDSFLNRAYIDLYLRYKRRQGYSDEEIQRKREALENVLIPYRVEENVDMLRRCGFRTVDMFFRWFNFASFVAVKDA